MKKRTASCSTIIREVVPGSFRFFVISSLKSALLVFIVSSIALTLALRESSETKALAWGVGLAMFITVTGEVLHISSLYFVRHWLRMTLTVTDCKLAVMATSPGHRPYRMLRCALAYCRWSSVSGDSNLKGVEGRRTPRPLVYLDVPVHCFFIRFRVRLPCGYNSDVAQEWSRLLKACHVPKVSGDLGSSISPSPEGFSEYHQK